MCGQPLFEFGFRHGPAKQVTLTELAAQFGQEIALRLVFDAFGGYLESQ